MFSTVMMIALSTAGGCHKCHGCYSSCYVSSCSVSSCSAVSCSSCYSSCSCHKVKKHKCCGGGWGCHKSRKCHGCHSCCSVSYSCSASACSSSCGGVIIEQAKPSTGGEMQKTPAPAKKQPAAGGSSSTTAPSVETVSDTQVITYVSEPVVVYYRN